MEAVHLANTQPAENDNRSPIITPQKNSPCKISSMAFPALAALQSSNWAAVHN